MADAEQVDAIRGSKFDLWRKQNPHAPIDLSDADLSECYIGHCDLAGADLRGANVSKSTLTLVNLRGAIAHGLNADGASFDQCILDNCELSEPASPNNDHSPNRFLIDAFTARRPRFVSRADSRLANFHGARLHQCSLASAGLDFANLTRVDLSKASFTGASLVGAMFVPDRLREVSFQRADLRDANLAGADLCGVDFSHAKLENAVLVDANLGPKRSVHMRNLTVGGNVGATVESFRHPEELTILRGANLRGADLRNACLVGADLTGADLCGARVFGVSAWAVNLDGANDAGLIVTHPQEPELIVDGLELAQFMHLMLNNERLRRVIDTITSKVVLVLGNFSPEWKPTLDELRRLLRDRGYVPVLYDFQKPSSRTDTETVDLLGRMARFVIVEVSEPRCAPWELCGITRGSPSVPIILLCKRGYTVPSMLYDCRTVETSVEYDDLVDLSERLLADVIERAERAVGELRDISRSRRAQQPRRADS